MSRIVQSVLPIALVAGFACAGPRVFDSQDQAVFPTRALDDSVHVVEAAGPVYVKVSAESPWSELTGGHTGSVVALQTRDAGAKLRLADTGALLWLGKNTQVELGLDNAGSHHFGLVQGRARIRHRAAGVRGFFATDNKAKELTGGDAVLRRAGGHGALHYIATEREPRAAQWTSTIASEPAPAGLGTLRASGDDEGSDNSIRLRRVQVEAESRGDMAEVTVEHAFFHEGDQQLEGTFRFPLPAGSVLLGLSMEIGGEMMQGELVERVKARQTYESIVDNMLDPALLEWEQGNWFKLRVFPIEPKTEKRVVLRYLTPLQRDGDGYDFVYSTAAPAMTASIDRFVLAFDGDRIVDETDFRAGEDIRVAVADTMPSLMAERVGDDQFTVVQFRPDWPREPTQSLATAPRNIVVIVDTSRSALESRSLAISTAEMVLAELDDRDRFTVIASDLLARSAFPTLRSATPAAKAQSLDFIKQISNDGATDLAAAFTKAKQVSPMSAGRTVQVVYLGEGTPTWGIRKTRDVVNHVAALPKGMSVHAGLLGKGTDLALWQEVSATVGGRVAQLRNLASARQFASFVAHSARTERIANAKLVVPDGHELFPNKAMTLFRGDEITAIVRSPKGGTPLREVVFQGNLGGKEVSHIIEVKAPVSVVGASQRWARHKIEALEQAGADKDVIVSTSKRYGIMSKYTSFLVLESEAAYREHKIARAQAAKHKNLDPQVSGQDLESLRNRRASLSPDEIQPGDPEIMIPAPADARSVVVVFPFGDTKIAAYSADKRHWMTRFLIDKDTPDGRYSVRVNITHADGRVESFTLPYWVDTAAPMVDLRLQRLPRGRYRITATQKRQLLPLPGSGGVTPNRADARTAQIIYDLHRVEVSVAGNVGKILWRKRPGVFRRVMKLPVAAEFLRVVVTDRALNQRVYNVSIAALLAK